MCHFLKSLFIKLRARLLCILMLSFILCACGKPQPLTLQEQDAYMAKQQCEQEATNMNPEFPGPENPDWASYFVMCMNQLGVSDTAISRMWDESYPWFP